MGNRTITIDACHPFDVSRFKQRVKLFQPGLYEFDSFTLKTESQKVVFQSNKDENS